jgi:predicted phage tail protein
MAVTRTTIPVPRDIVGRGGGKSSSSATTPTEEANSLASNAFAYCFDLISEGPIEGLVDGANSVFFNNTPWGYTDGGGAQQYNFQGVQFSLVQGLPDQGPLSGPSDTETTYEVDAQVKFAQPVTRQISSEYADHVRVTLQIPALVSEDTNTGEVGHTSVEIQILIQANGGSYYVAVDDTIDGKTTTVYEKDYTIPLPAGGYPWNVQMSRITADSTVSTLSNDTYFLAYTEIISVLLTYPNDAIACVGLNAQDFGSAIPTRSYLVKGLQISIPSNYDPIALTYDGMWDGTFQTAWTCNPAWVFYDLLTNNRYGMGNVVSAEQVDKWALYQIAQYCDELVPDGYGNQEPRYTFNMQITSAQDAYSALQMIASVFRGMIYWGAGTIIATADMPETGIAKILTNANVKDGQFIYSGAPLSSYHSICQVTWNDPSQNYQPTVETIVDDAAVLQFGSRVSQIYAYGCTSRGQARRTGLWLLYTERNQTETMTCTVALDQMADVRPGDIVAVADQWYQGVRYAGRIVANDGSTYTEGPTDGTLVLESGAPVYVGGDVLTTEGYTVPPGLVLTLDSNVTLPAGDSYTIRVFNQYGNTLQEQGINLDLTGTGPTNQIVVNGVFAQSVGANAVWMIYCNAVNPRLFQILTVTEQDGSEFQITGLFFDPDKFAEVELGLNLVEPNYTTLPTGAIAPPSNVSVQDYITGVGQTTIIRTTVSWTNSPDSRVNAYQVRASSDQGFYGTFAATGGSKDIDNLPVANYVFGVRACSVDGQYSVWVDAAAVYIDGQPIPPAAPTDLVAVGGTRQIQLTWNASPSPSILQYEVWRGNSPEQSPGEGATFLADVSATSYMDADSNTLLPNTTWYYWVRAQNTLLSLGPFEGPASGTTTLLVAADLEQGILDTASFAATIKAPYVIANLSVHGIAYNDLAVNEENSQLYIWNGTTWNNVVSAGSLYGQLGAGQFAANSVTAGVVAAGAIGSSQIAAGQVRAVNLASDTLITLSAQIGNAVITNANIANLSVDNAKIGNLAVGTSNIQTQTVTQTYQGVRTSLSDYINGTETLVSLTAQVPQNGKILLLARILPFNLGGGGNFGGGGGGEGSGNGVGE